MLGGSPGDIPIVHSLYDLYASWNVILEKFPKRQRYVLGETCSRFFLTSLELTLQTASTLLKNEKLALLRAVSAKVDTLKLLIRLSKDCGCMTNNQYLDTESRLIEIGKMLGGWIKSLS